MATNRHNIMVEILKMDWTLELALGPLPGGHGEDVPYTKDKTRRKSKEGDSVLTDAMQLYPDGVRLFQEGDENKLVTGLEVQRTINDDKFFSWGCYPGHLLREYRCTPRLIILCSTQEVTDWARKGLKNLPVALGTPAKVLGPDSFARLLQAPPSVQNPALALMGAALRAESVGSRAPAYPYVETLNTLAETADRELSALCYKALRAFFKKEEVKMIDDMTELEREHENEWLAVFGQGTIEEAEARGEAKGEARGKAEGEARGEIRALIKFRGLLCTEEQAAQIEAEQDVETLRRWAERAPTAPSVEAILQDEER